MFEQERWPAGAQGPVTDLSHLQAGVYLQRHTLELALSLESPDKVAQVFVFHGPVRCRGRYAFSPLGHKGHKVDGENAI